MSFFICNYARANIDLVCSPRGPLHRAALCFESVGMGKLSARVKAEAKATGIVVMKVFIFESFRIVRPLFVLCVGQMFTCTDAHDS